MLTHRLGTILDARYRLLIACGEAKAATVAAAIEGPLSASRPTSVLQLHPRTSRCCATTSPALGRPTTGERCTPSSLSGGIHNPVVQPLVAAITIEEPNGRS